MERISFNRKLVKVLFSEFIATFIFLFAIMAVGVNVERSGESSGALVLAGLCTFFSALACIRAFGDWSGAHMNPGVTFGAIVGGKMNPYTGLLYMATQVGASVFAVLFIILMFPSSGNAAKLVIHPGKDASWWNELLSEFILSFILVYIIYETVLGASVAPQPTGVINDVESEHPSPQTSRSTPTVTGEQKLILKMDSAPMAIAATLAFLGFLAGSVSGGAYNPARATGPALLTGDFGSLWVFWLGNLAGAGAAAALHTYVFMKF